MYKRLNITLPEDLLSRADDYAVRERYTRSGLIATAVEAFIGTRGGSEVVEEPRAAYATVASARPDLSFPRVADVLGAFFSARADVEAAWVFGSVARETAGPSSDVDVAVIPSGDLDSEARWRLRVDLMSRLAGVIGAETVDVAVWPDLSIQLAFDIAGSGRQVYGHDSRVAAETMISAVTDYWDYQPVMQHARVALAERLKAYGRSE